MSLSEVCSYESVSFALRREANEKIWGLKKNEVQIQFVFPSKFELLVRQRTDSNTFFNFSHL